jgi:hypothetical protein
MMIDCGKDIGSRVSLDLNVTRFIEQELKLLESTIRPPPEIMTDPSIEQRHFSTSRNSSTGQMSFSAGYRRLERLQTTNKCLSGDQNVGMVEKWYRVRRMRTTLIGHSTAGFA